MRILSSLPFPRSIPCESSTTCLFGSSAPSSTNRATASSMDQKRHMAVGRYWRRLATNQRQAQIQVVPPRVQIAGASISFACLIFVIKGSSIDPAPMERSAMAHGRLEASSRASFGANAGNIADCRRPESQQEVDMEMSSVNPEHLPYYRTPVPCCRHTQASFNSSLRWLHMPQGGLLLVPRSCEVTRRRPRRLSLSKSLPTCCCSPIL